MQARILCLLQSENCVFARIQQGSTATKSSALECMIFLPDFCIAAFTLPHVPCSDQLYDMQICLVYDQPCPTIRILDARFPITTVCIGAKRLKHLAMHTMVEQCPGAR